MDYNKHMTYIDKIDKLKSLYMFNRKSKKWWHRILWHFISVILTNVFIIYQELGNKKIIDSEEFYISYCKYSLVGGVIPTEKGRKASENVRRTTNHKSQLY